MSLFETFETDESVEKEGLFLNYGKNKDGTDICIKIARAGGANTAYHKAINRKMKPYSRQYQAGVMDLEVQSRIVKEAFAETVVIGWEHVQERDGTEIPFSRENCIKLFERLPELFVDIQEQATKSTLFRNEVLEGDSKN